jgi:hypothetical protein
MNNMGQRRAISERQEGLLRPTVSPISVTRCDDSCCMDFLRDLCIDSVFVREMRTRALYIATATAAARCRPAFCRVKLLGPWLASQWTKAASLLKNGSLALVNLFLCLVRRDCVVLAKRIRGVLLFVLLV